MSKYNLIKINGIYKLIDTSEDSDIRYIRGRALLSDYYLKRRELSQIKPILELLKDDYYFYILKEIYKDNCLLESIASTHNIDLSTLKRNKKRLTLIIYDLWEEAKQNE